MKLNKFFASLAVLGLLVFTAGCYKSFDDLEQNPNKATSAPPSIILNGVCWDFFRAHGEPFETEQRWNQFYCLNYNYYGTNEYSWAAAPFRYSSLNNVVKMEQEATTAGLPAVNPYSALGKFFRAFFFIDMSQRVGDVPMTEALKGIENPAPRYDSQKDVYKQALVWLESANADINEILTRPAGTTADGDFLYGGDLRKWQKAINAYRLRVLISLSKKEADADLDIKRKFQTILNESNSPIFGSLADNLQFTWNSTANKYPVNPDVFGFDDGRVNHSNTFLGGLLALKDPRVFIVAEPADSLLKLGFSASQFEAYAGAPSGEDLADMSIKMNKGLYSFPSLSRYYSNYAPEPTMLVGYPELCFAIAEAANRGWATSVNAEDFYKKGIEAAMNFMGITDAAAIASYLAQPAVKYKTGAAGLNQILTQKYFAFNQNSGLEAYFQWRRTGIPAFHEGVGTGNGGKIPQRWLYPNSERSTNKVNLDAALGTQFGGKDDVNDQLWLVK